MIFGHCRINNKIQLVCIMEENFNSKTVFVRRTYKDIPTGKPIKRHFKKHGVRVHGYNVIRYDWMEQSKG